MTLFLTTRGILLYQMKDQLDAINLNTGVIGDGQTRAVRGVNLGMVQTLVQALQEPSLDGEIRAIVKSCHNSKDRDPNTPRDEIVKEAQAKYERKKRRRDAIIKFLSMIEVVIGEEAHEVGGESYYEILRHCKNASIRVALTATPFMRADAEDNMRLMAAFGPILINVSEEMLIERGILARPFFKFRDVRPHDKLRKSSPYERALKLGHTENPSMHAAIIADAQQAAKRKLPVLTLVIRKQHGENLLREMKAAGLRAAFLRGENDMEDRKRKLRQLASGEIDVILGTNILDVGVDVPSIGLVQLAGGGKAQVALRQRVGRGLREKKKFPNFAFIADYTCYLNKTLSDHAKMRRSIIMKTPGFAEGVIEDGRDFDWSIFDHAGK
jgi:superfamily II DNA or RNA helicase